MRTYRKLTQRDIDSAKPGAREHVLWDYQQPGFGLRVRPSGARTYIFLYRIHGKVRRFTIGKASVFSLEQARKRAKELAFGAASGIDPAAIKIKARTTSLESVFAQYDESRLSYLSPGHRSRVKGIFKNYVVPEFGRKPIGEVTRSDVRLLTNRVIAKGKKAMANNIHRTMSAFLGWCYDDGELIDVNPLAGVRLPSRTPSRDRVLSANELAIIWHACEQLDAKWRNGIRLLMLTGQRKTEVLGAELREFDLQAGKWTIPAQRSKNRHAQTVHLSAEARAAVDAVPRFAGQRYLFQSHITKTPRPIAETNASVKRLKRIVPIKNWRLHDLRRSMATHMAELKIAPHVIQVVLNHKSGYRTGVTAIYNRYTYSREAQDAWQLWGSTLARWTTEKIPSDSCSTDEEAVVL